MNGKIVGGAIVLSALVTGVAVYYLQVYGYYQELPATAPAAEIRLTSVVTGQPEPILAEGFEGIDADSSPLRFRGCFRTPLSLGLLTETFTVYEGATPLNGPGWFGCFDAARIGEDIERGEAVAFLSEHDIQPGVDRVVAVYPDGRAFAWHQLNESAEK
ncbi:DUF6446 family protein [Pseudothioclava nitratireducens]|uniref:DUF6446 family protein n=1 Tax=Pseudothioclava nitratireducens TaxID=1928646 RepID=UPI0023DB28C6|nr:DUF6446 family protein [Defluviimonas nitratireducens]MDF1619623.1 DUF6446 family protein [Defluviimonas nitratireducens]